MAKTRALKINAANMPTMPAPCKTCPFGPGGDPELADRVLRRTLFQASQLCHSTAVAVKGKRETHLCRGQRDIQVKIRQ